VKGHLDQEGKNLQSTKLKKPNIHDDFFPVPNQPNVKSYDACTAIIPFTCKGTAYHDLTGCHSHTSSRGSQYILVVYDYDSNAILHSTLMNKTAAEITKGWTNIYKRLQRRGNPPNMYILDNKASNDLKKALKKHDLSYQLVPPHVHS
jgi:hypothetical protein